MPHSVDRDPVRNHRSSRPATVVTDPASLSAIYDGELKVIVPETALTAFDRSFALSSSLALALGFSSVVRAWKGDDAIAVEQANRALRLSPLPTPRSAP